MPILMLNHFKFIFLGSLSTTFASYFGFYTLVRDQKIFITNYLEAFSVTFILFLGLSLIIWFIGFLLMLLILKLRNDFNHLKAFYYSATLLITFGLLVYLFFRILVIDLPFNPWFFIFPGIPLYTALFLAPFLTKHCYHPTS